MSDAIRDVVPPALAGERLDRVVALMAHLSRSAAAALIEAGGVQVDDRVESSGKRRVGEAQVVEIDLALVPVTPLPSADPAIELRVLHEDEHVVVIDKQAGLVVHPGAGNPEGTLVNGLLARYPEIAGVGEPARPGIVHRLDAGTSGVLVVARTPVAYELMVAAMARRDVSRRYVALVWGHPEQRHGVIDAPIGRDPRDPLRMAVVIDGRPARTRYGVVETLERPTPLALLDCELETGRTHQIRVHLAAIDHPVVGDVTYGVNRPTLGLERPFLHAAELSFDHPVTGERITVASPLASDLQEFLDEARAG